MGLAKENGPLGQPKRAGHGAGQREQAMGWAKEGGPWGQPKRAGHWVSQREWAMGPAKESKQLGLARIILGKHVSWRPRRLTWERKVRAHFSLLMGEIQWS